MTILVLLHRSLFCLPAKEKLSAGTIKILNEMLVLLIILLEERENKTAFNS